MLLKDNKKKIASVIISKLNSPDMSPDLLKKKDEESECSHYMECAQGILSAIEAKDPEALAMSLQKLMESSEESES